MDPLDDYLRRSFRTPDDIEADVIRRGGSFDNDSFWPAARGRIHHQEER